MSAQEKEVTGKVEADATEGNEQNSIIFSPDLVDEKIKTSLEPSHAQISALTDMMDRMIQSNSARETTRMSTRETRYQNESPFSGAPGASRFPMVAPLTTSEYSPDIGFMPSLLSFNAKLFNLSLNFLRGRMNVLAS